jgi:sugar phosphate isomerase/epimerase
MRVGIFAKTFPGAAPKAVLAAARDAGFQSVQYNMACSGIGALPRQIEPEAAVAVAQASADTGIAIAAISATYNMIHPDMSVRLAGRASFAAIAAAASSVGSDLLTVCTGSRDAEDQWRHHPDNASADAWADMCTEFEALIGIAENCNVLIGIEPELANVIDSAAKARKLIDEMGSRRLCIVLDPANLFEVEAPEQRKDILARAIDLLGDRIAIAHAKDRNADGSFATAGKGVIDFGHYIGRLKSVGFAGDLITHGLAANEAAGAASFLKSALAST